MITKYQEILALMLHSLSLICECLVYYINKNLNIKFLCIYDIAQHLLKIFRILIFGYEFIGTPKWICILHSFFNHFTHDGSIIMSCLYLFSILYLYILLFEIKKKKI